jgi:hypothetical protein
MLLPAPSSCIRYLTPGVKYLGFRSREQIVGGTSSAALKTGSLRITVDANQPGHTISRDSRSCFPSSSQYNCIFQLAISNVVCKGSAASESSIVPGIPNTRAQVAWFTRSISRSSLLTDLARWTRRSQRHRDTRKDTKAIKSRYVIPFECPYVLSKVRGSNYGWLSSPGLLFEPAAQDELDMEDT